MGREGSGWEIIAPLQSINDWLLRVISPIEAMQTLGLR